MTCDVSNMTLVRRPADPEKLEMMNKWVDRCSVIRSEIFGDGVKACRKRIGNVLPMMTIPVFAGLAPSWLLVWVSEKRDSYEVPLIMIATYFPALICTANLIHFGSFGQMLTALAMMPLVKELSFPLLLFGFKVSVEDY